MRLINHWSEVASVRISEKAMVRFTRSFERERSHNSYLPGHRYRLEERGTLVRALLRFGQHRPFP